MLAACGARSADAMACCTSQQAFGGYRVVLHRAQARPARVGRPSAAGLRRRGALVCSALPEQEEPWVAPWAAPQRADGRARRQAAELAGKAPSLLLGLGAVTGGGLLGSGFDLSGPESVLQALGVLGLTVGIHETGHFLAARLQGIHVTKFAIGFGPTLFKYQGKEVEYSLRAFPLGGYVAFPDDDPACPYPKDDPDLLNNRSVGQRVMVVTAGVIANLILAFAICTVQAGTVGVVESTYLPGVKLGTIMEGTVAQRAGLQKGDVILSVGSLKVAPSPEAVNQVVDAIRDSPKQELDISLRRDGKLLTLPVTPAEMPDGTGRIGVQLAPNANIVKRKAGSPLQAVEYGSREFSQLAGTVARGLQQFVTNFAATASQVSGPVAIVAVGAEVAKADPSGLFQFAALININLAIVNILPLPALDGGFLVFLLIEAVRGGKRVDADWEKGIMASGLLVLMTAGVFLIVRDALNLAGLGNLL